MSPGQPAFAKGLRCRLGRLIRAIRRPAPRQTDRSIDMVLDHIGQGLVVLDAQCRVRLCNRHYLELFGFAAGAIRPGIALRDVLAHSIALGNYPGADPDALTADLVARLATSQPQSYERSLADGRILAVRWEPLPEGGWVLTFEDVTERRLSVARVAHMTRHDALTDLPNRLAFHDTVAEALGRGQHVAVLCVNLDRFKAVNDTLGHRRGDALLREAASRLRQSVRDTDAVARLGGDEFAILQIGEEQPDAASLLAGRVMAALSRPYDIDDHRAVVGASIGIALASREDGDVDRLLRNADLALVLAKREGAWQNGQSIYRFFEPDMDARAQARRALELDLRQALEGGQFELYYQPLINIHDRRVSGFEGLLRWHHPTRGLVPPDAFIPLAEEIGLIVPIGAWVLRTACAEAMTWTSKPVEGEPPPPPAHVAVNLSPVQFSSPGLVETVQAALAESGLPASRLELEITESVLLQDNAATLDILHRLRRLGVGISMDDFGTGYSSLSYLRSFPFDKIKIDKSFIQSEGESEENMAIVRAIAGLGTSLGIATTAEGVETLAQLERLIADGCTEVQGYFFSPPRPARDVPALLAEAAAQQAA